MNRSTRNLLAIPLLCLICGLAIVAAHAMLSPRIEAQQHKAAEAIYFDALNLPAGAAQLDASHLTEDSALLGLRAPQPIYIARRDNRSVGVVLPLTAREGYGGDIDLLLGLDTDGKIISVRIVSHHETRNLGDRIEPDKSNWLEQFCGLAFAAEQKSQWQLHNKGGAFDGITGATVTSNAVVKATQQGLEYFAAHRDELLEEDRHD